MIETDTESAGSKGRAREGLCPSWARRFRGLASGSLPQRAKCIQREEANSLTNASNPTGHHRARAKETRGL